MSIHVIMILLILFSLIAVYVDRHIGNAPPAKPNFFTGSGVAADANVKPVWYQRWRRQQPLSQAQRFRAWCQQALRDHPDVQDWLNRMSSERFSAFTNEVTAFCLAFGIELEWLINQELTQFPVVKEELVKALAHYSRAHQTVTAVQDQIVAWKAYRTFDHNPYVHESQPFVQALFAKLVEQELTPALPAELADKTETDRQIYRVQIIRQTAERQTERFQQVAVVAALAINSAQTASPASTQKSRQQRWMFNNGSLMKKH